MNEAENSNYNKFILKKKEGKKKLPPIKNEKYSKLSEICEKNLSSKRKLWINTTINSNNNRKGNNLRQDNAWKMQNNTQNPKQDLNKLQSHKIMAEQIDNIFKELDSKDKFSPIGKSSNHFLKVHFEDIAKHRTSGIQFRKEISEGRLILNEMNSRMVCGPSSLRKKRIKVHSRLYVDFREVYYKTHK